MSPLDTSTSLFGQALSMPVMLGPVGFSGMFAHRGERQAARAAEAAGGVPFALSTLSICPLEEVRAAVAARRAEGGDGAHRLHRRKENRPDAFSVTA